MDDTALGSVELMTWEHQCLRWKRGDESEKARGREGGGHYGTGSKGAMPRFPRVMPDSRHQSYRPASTERGWRNGGGLIKCFLPVPTGRGSEWWLVNAHWIEQNSIKLNWSKGMPFLSPRREAGSAEGAILQQWSKACTCTGPSPLATRRDVPRRGLLEMDQWNQKPKFLVRV